MESLFVAARWLDPTSKVAPSVPWPGPIQADEIIAALGLALGDEVLRRWMTRQNGFRPCEGVGGFWV